MKKKLKCLIMVEEYNIQVKIINFQSEAKQTQ